MPEVSEHFRRQMAVGAYVADFVRLGRRLIIEVDGKIHEDRDQRLRDVARDTYLRDQGFRVMRFSNTDVMSNMPFVLGRIAALVATSSPQGGGEPEARL
jgi:very-short-patch-repair endonuclease